MSSHQDYLQRLRVTHVLMDPAHTLPSVMTAREYTEVKAFVLETAAPSSAPPTALLPLLLQQQQQPLMIDDPAKFNLRGLPVMLVAECPPAYPMCGTDDLSARANRTAPVGYPRRPGACVIVKEDDHRVVCNRWRSIASRAVGIEQCFN